LLSKNDFKGRRRSRRKLGHKAADCKSRCDQKGNGEAPVIFNFYKITWLFKVQLLEVIKETGTEPIKY